MDITASKLGKSLEMLHSNDGLRASACADTCYWNRAVTTYLL